MSHDQPLLRRYVHFLAVLSIAALLGSCSDAPQAPVDAPTGPAYLVVAPRFAAAADGNTVTAQQEAFDQVDNYRAVVLRIQSREVVKDTVIQVERGASQHDLTIPIQINAAEESFVLQLTALAGTIPLFSVEATVTATSNGTGGGSPTPTPVTLQYTGPGAGAAAVSFVPRALVVPPGGTRTLRARVLDAEGREISGVPLAFSSSVTAVATVAQGVVTGVADGATRVTVSTPTGVTAEAVVYVVSGEVAYVSGGGVFQAAVGGISATNRTSGVTGAAQPAWHPGGGRLFYTAGGAVREAGRGEVGLTGEWPAVSPDGSKFAVQRGGDVWFANVDGSNPTPGPAGSQPQWSGSSAVVVSGGSIERVNAEDGSRTTIAGDPGARSPGVGPGGRVAWVSGGGLFTSAGGGNLLSPQLVARGRPTWSPDGRWLIVAASSEGLPSTLHVVPADGSGPAVALGIETTAQEGEPAWRPAGPAANPAAVVIQGLSPTRPLPGQEVEVRGSGFDGIIRANNQVFFPTEEGPTEATLLETSSDVLQAVVPPGVMEGTLRVKTFTGEGTLEMSPSIGNLRVVARTSYGKDVAGVDVRLAQGGETIGTGTTGADGTVTFTNLFSGSYDVEVTAVREGFEASAPGGPYEVSVDATTTVELAVEAEVAQLALTSGSPIRLEAPGEEAEATAEARDVDGDLIPAAEIAWNSDAPGVASVEGSGPTVTVRGVTPGDAVLTASAGDHSARADVSVQGAVSGSVRTSGGKGVSGSTLELRDGGEVVGAATTDETGAFRMTGLPLGSFDLLLAELRDGFEASEGGATRSVSLSEGSAEPEVTFTVRAEVRALTLSASEVTLSAPGEQTTLEADPRDVDGDAIENATVEWSASDPTVLELSSSAAEGAALVTARSILVTGLAPGEAQVSASAGQAQVSADVSVLGGIRGSVLYDYGAPFPGAELVLSRDDSEVARTTTGPDGTFLLDELGVGQYQIRLAPQDGFPVVGSDVRDVTVASGAAAPEVLFQVDPEARSVEVTAERALLQQGDTVAGQATVRDARGTEIPNPEVDWTSSDETVVRVESATNEGSGGAASRASVALVAGPEVRVIAEGPGSANVTATVDDATAGLEVQVVGAIRGRLVRTDGAPFEGGVVRLSQGGSEVREPVTTGADGTFEFLDLEPADYSIRVVVPSGFSVQGSNPRSVTVGPGLGLVEVLVKPTVQGVVISPSEPVVEAGSSIRVTATALDARGDPITSVGSVRWSAVTPQVSASGTTLAGTLRGNFPTAETGEARFSVTVEGASFEFRATVTSFIEGTVTDGGGSALSGIVLRLFSGEEEIVATNTGFTGHYRFGSLPAGSYVVQPEPPAGETVSPSSASFSLGVEVPSGRADFVVGGVGPIDLTGRPVLVFGDRFEGANIANELAALGMSVTQVSTLPLDLSPYQVIFHFGAFQALTAEERTRLEAFVNGGGGLHLTGERPCCEVMNQSHELLVNALVAGGGIQIGGMGDFSGPYPFNASARGSFSTTPNDIPEWFPSAPGGITGVSGANILVTAQPTGTTVGAIWSDADMASGNGRMTILMDVNWASGASSTVRPLVENLATFLARGAPPRAAARAPGTVRRLDSAPAPGPEASGPKGLEDPTRIPEGTSDEVPISGSGGG